MSTQCFKPTEGRKLLSDQADITFAVGDVHGRADLLRQLQTRMLAHSVGAAAMQPKVVYLGDYVDRGHQSRQVVDLLLDGLPEFERIYLKGNHEELMEFFTRQDPDEAALDWFRNGGGATLASYDVRCDSLVDFCSRHIEIHNEFTAAMQGRHHVFFQNLRLSYADDRGIYVHAGLNPRMRLEAQRSDDILWIREPFLNSSHDWGRRIYHGHTPAKWGPEVRPNRVNVDTGAFHSGILTAVVAGADPVFITDSDPATDIIIFDPNGEGSSWWGQWATSVAVASGAQRASILTPNKEIAQVLKATGISVSHDALSTFQSIGLKPGVISLFPDNKTKTSTYMPPDKGLARLFL